MSEENQSQVVTKQKQGNTPAFLEKLFDILEDNQAHSHLISWQADGTSFIIKKVSEFSEIVLPRYFKHSNIQSYVRQLNMYGFSKTRHDSNHHEFTHRLFQKGRRDLLPFIRRKTQSGGKHGHSNIPEDILKTLKPTTGISSEAEASQSDNMDEELLLDIMEPSLAMQSRVIELEEQVSQLTKACNELLHQHNFLCEALQTQQEEEVTCPKCEFVFKPADNETNANSKRTTQDLSSSSSQKRLKRSGIIDESSAMDGITDYETAHEHPFPSDEHLFSTTTSSHPMQHRSKLNFMKYKAKISPALEPLSLEPVVPVKPSSSSRASSNDSKASTSSSNNKQKNMKLLPSFAQRSQSLDLGGLEAITAAATYLDDRHPLAQGQQASSRSSSGNNNAAALRSSSRSKGGSSSGSGSATTGLKEVRGGDPIVKSNSFG